MEARAHRNGWIVTTAAVVLGLLGAARADAQVGCGGVIGPDTTVVLDRDLDCGGGWPALTVVGPATLDLSGFAVSCGAGVVTPGIVVLGRGATVRDGSVTGCGNGVELRGAGGHRLESVVASVNGTQGKGHGILVASSDNVLGGNIALQNAGDGVRVVGDRNRLVANRSFFNGISGFALLLGEQNVAQDNVAGGNDAAGFTLDAGPLGPGVGRNVVERNTARGNTIGFVLLREQGTRLSANVAEGNRNDGIFVASGRRNRLDQNLVQANGRSGIVVGAATGSVLERNTALGHEPAPGVRRFDLIDAAATSDCGSNQWRQNVFETRNARCIE